MTEVRRGTLENSFSGSLAQARKGLSHFCLLSARTWSHSHLYSKGGGECTYAQEVEEIALLKRAVSVIMLILGLSHVTMKPTTQPRHESSKCAALNTSGVWSPLPH